MGAFWSEVRLINEKRHSQGVFRDGIPPALFLQFYFSGGFYIVIC